MAALSVLYRPFSNLAGSSRGKIPGQTDLALTAEEDEELTEEAFEHFEEDDEDIFEVEDP